MPRILISLFFNIPGIFESSSLVKEHVLNLFGRYSIKTLDKHTPGLN